jgi:nucleotide-binding universal stress UspA family protein
MYRKVLIPLDGSPFAERILPHIERLISSQQTEFILLSVVEPTSYVISPRTMTVMEAFDTTHLRQNAEVYLRQVKGELREMGLRVHEHVIEGDVASAICDVADTQDADLIAMTTHGRSGMGRWAFGSIADRVIRTASQPIFLVRGTAEVPSTDAIRRILVPLDGSELAERVLPQAQALVTEKGAELLLVRAVEPLTDWEVAEIYANWESIDDVYSHRQTAAERYLEQVQEQLRAASVPSTIVVNEGHPAKMILDTAEAENVDLIVMSTHGRSGLARWVYGSIADKVLHGTTRPLLLIRARPEVVA